MAKKNNNIRLTKEELTNLQTLVKIINQLQLQIGGLEIQKSTILERVKTFQRDVEELQKKFRKKYGDVIVDINNGNLKERPTKDEVN